MASCNVLSFCNYMRWYLNKEVDYYSFTDVFVSIQLACHTLEYPPQPLYQVIQDSLGSWILQRGSGSLVSGTWIPDSEVPDLEGESKARDFGFQSKKSPGSERNPDVLACFIGMYTLANGTRLSPLEVKTKVYCENMKPFKQKLLE